MKKVHHTCSSCVASLSFVAGYRGLSRITAHWEWGSGRSKGSPRQWGQSRECIQVTQKNRQEEPTSWCIPVWRAHPQRVTTVCYIAVYFWYLLMYCKGIVCLVNTRCQVYRYLYKGMICLFNNIKCQIHVRALLAWPTAPYAGYMWRYHWPSQWLHVPDTVCVKGIIGLVRCVVGELLWEERVWAREKETYCCLVRWIALLEQVGNKGSCDVHCQANLLLGQGTLGSLLGVVATGKVFV
jgi:hypothetical protein